jgi:hypothetical protein
MALTRLLYTPWSVLRGFLFSEKAPYVVTLFVAAAAWASIRTADRLSDTPFIEYQITTVRLEPARVLEVRLRNLTRSTAFQCFQLTIVSADTKRLSFGAPETWDQVLRGTVLVLGTARTSDAREAVMEIQNLYPGGDFALRLPVRGDGEPRLLARGCPGASPANVTQGAEQDKAKGGGSTPLPILVAASARTFFVEWEITILWTALVGWGILMLIALGLRGAKATSTEVDLQERRSYDQGSID